MKKMLFYVFDENPMCANHVFLNALDMNEKGYEVGIILEGAATKLPQVLEEKEHPLYLKTKELGLFISICEACSKMMGSYEYNLTCGIPLDGELSGHPALEPFLKEGFEIVKM